MGTLKPLYFWNPWEIKPLGIFIFIAFPINYIYNRKK